MCHIRDMNAVLEQNELESVGVLYRVQVGNEVWTVDLADVFEQRLVGATCGRKLRPEEAERQTERN